MQWQRRSQGWAFALPSNFPVAHSLAIIFVRLVRLMHGSVLNYLLYENMYCTCTFLFSVSYSNRYELIRVNNRYHVIHTGKSIEKF